MKYDIMSAIRDEIAKIEKDNKQSLYDDKFLEYVKLAISDITQVTFPELYQLKFSELLPSSNRNELNVNLINKDYHVIHFFINGNGYTLTSEADNILINCETSMFTVNEELSTIRFIYTFQNDIIKVDKTSKHTIEISVYQNAASEFNGSISDVLVEPYLIPDNVHVINSTKDNSGYKYECTLVSEEEEYVPKTSRYKYSYLRHLGITFMEQCEREDEFNKYHVYKRGNK